jgi:EAL domain-containing protein (putative c-di-GMP-specific phosphodiesterase class I)
MRDLIEPAFQPVFGHRHDIVMYEALVRFRGQANDPRSREHTVARWDSSGFIATVDRAMLTHATQALVRIPTARLVSVNVSPTTIEREADRYLAQLRHPDTAAKRLVVEVSPSRIEDPAALVRFARWTVAAGARVALDDFRPGAPGCTISLLQMLRPPLVKLSRSTWLEAFSTKNAASVAGFIGEAEQLGVRTVVVGIESKDMLDWAAESLGARYFQGFYLGAPQAIPAESTQAAGRASATEPSSAPLLG